MGGDITNVDTRIGVFKVEKSTPILLIEYQAKNKDIVDETTRLENYARDKKSLKGYVPRIPVVNVNIGNQPSSMTDQQLIDALKAQGVNVKPKAK